MIPTPPLGANRVNALRKKWQLTIDDWTPEIDLNFQALKRLFLENKF